MEYKISLWTIALFCLIAIVLGFPKLKGDVDLYSPYPPAVKDRNLPPLRLFVRRPTPTPTPSFFGSAPSSPLAQPTSRPWVQLAPRRERFTGTIDLAPDLPEREKVLLVLSNGKGELTGYLVAPDDLKAQRTRLIEERGPNSLRLVLYPRDRYLQ